MTRMIERTEGRYDVHQMPYGKVYVWRPGHIVVAWCDCGERPTLTLSVATCSRCGADHTAVVREELDGSRLGDEALHPWRYLHEYQEATRGIVRDI